MRNEMPDRCVRHEPVLNFPSMECVKAGCAPDHPEGLAYISRSTTFCDVCNAKPL